MTMETDKYSMKIFALCDYKTNIHWSRKVYTDSDISVVPESNRDYITLFNLFNTHFFCLIRKSLMGEISPMNILFVIYF